MSTEYPTHVEREEQGDRTFLRAQDQFLLAAAAFSLVGSVYLFMTGQTQTGLFVGLWVPSILSLGNYLQNMSTRR